MYLKATNAEAVAMEQNLWEGIARFDVSALMALLERVLMQVDPEKTVYCIIDSISDYQSVFHDWADPTLYVLQSLHRLADRRDQTPRLTLLMTSANRTKDVPLIVNQASGEYVALRSGRSDERPIHRQAFDRDICTLMHARSYKSDFSSP
ncbi:unnamed protein product [Periconia digitata]|uniref:Uncharacterized protein n=1 Tax=Periconia digitata TaxID=1303443 RepID=A0A9W4USS3_9PLEO|nr:unnamed protein product [Periconia digitata]